MQLTASYPHIEKPSDSPARLERLPRIRVAQIVADYTARNWSPDEICRNYPHLTPAEVHAAMLYYYDHREEIDTELRRDWQEYLEAQSASTESPAVARLRSHGPN
jgi:hypothetical protein